MKQPINITPRHVGLPAYLYYVLVVVCSLLTPASTIARNSFEIFDHGSGRHHLNSGQILPVHSPFSIPLRPESEPFEENEVKADSDDELGKFFLALTLRQSLDLVSKKILFLQLLSSDENRQEVSLFILHHCWKSFLVSFQIIL